MTRPYARGRARASAGLPRSCISPATNASPGRTSFPPPISLAINSAAHATAMECRQNPTWSKTGPPADAAARRRRVAGSTASDAAPAGPNPLRPRQATTSTQPR